jgi:membrane protein required for colicin V production
MNWVDTMALLVVVLSAIIAFARGFVSEVLGIGAWIGAFFISSAFAPYIRPTMRMWLGNPDIADPAAYAAVFLVALIVLSILTGMAGGVVRASLLGGIDRTLGVVFGMLRGVLILAVGYVVATQVLPTDRWPDSVAQSRAVPHIYNVAFWLVRFLPEDYRPHVPRPPEPPRTDAAELLHATPQGRATAKP